MIDPFINQPEIMCDGCEKRFSESKMLPCYRHVDGSWETLHLCPSCRERDRKRADEAYLRSPERW